MDFHVVTLTVRRRPRRRRRRRRLSLSNFFMHVFFFVFAVVFFFTSYKPPNLRMFVEMMFRRASADMMTCDIAERCAPPLPPPDNRMLLLLQNHKFVDRKHLLGIILLCCGNILKEACVLSDHLIPPIQIQLCHSLREYLWRVRLKLIAVFTNIRRACLPPICSATPPSLKSPLCFRARSPPLERLFDQSSESHNL